MDLITISNIIFKANVTSLVRCRMEQKVPNCISSCCWQFEMIQETKSSVYSADPTLTIIVFDLLTIGGAKLSSVVGLFFISHCGKCEDEVCCVKWPHSVWPISPRPDTELSLSLSLRSLLGDVWRVIRTLRQLSTAFNIGIWTFANTDHTNLCGLGA